MLCGRLSRVTACHALCAANMLSSVAGGLLARLSHRCAEPAWYRIVDEIEMRRREVCTDSSGKGTLYRRGLREVLGSMQLIQSGTNP